MFCILVGRNEFYISGQEKAKNFWLVDGQFC